MPRFTEVSMGKSQVNLQDIFLNQMRKEKIPVTTYLVNANVVSRSKA